MVEYIEREKAIQFVLDACNECLDTCAEFDGIVPDCNQCMLDGVHRRLRATPAADVRPLVKSKWADNRIAFYRGCPECGAFVRANLDEVFLRDFPSAVGRLNFCPNCGADMREGE